MIISEFLISQQVLHPVTSFEGIEETGKQEVRMAKAVMIQVGGRYVFAPFVGHLSVNIYIPCILCFV